MDKKPEIGERVYFEVDLEGKKMRFNGEVIDTDLEDQSTAIVRVDPTDKFMQVKDLELNRTEHGHMVPKFEEKIKDDRKKVLTTYVCGQCPGRKCTTTGLIYDDDKVDEYGLPCLWVPGKVASFIQSG